NKVYLNTSLTGRLLRTDLRASEFLSLLLATVPGTHEGGDRRRNVRADPKPAVSNPQDELRIQPEIRLVEAPVTGTEEHDARDPEDRRRHNPGARHESPEEFLPRRDTRPARRHLARAESAGGHRGAGPLDHLRLPDRGRLDLAQALQEFIDVPVYMVFRRRRLDERRRERIRVRHRGSPPGRRLELPDLSGERASDRHGESAEPHQEDRGDHHVRRVDPARDLGRVPGPRLVVSEGPREVGDHEEIDAEGDRKGPWPDGSCYSTRTPSCRRGGYTSSPPFHF